MTYAFGGVGGNFGFGDGCGERDGRGPTVLTVPGLGGSGADHWQTMWERERTDTARAELGMWDAPRRNAWVTRLDQEIRAARAPVVLAAHSLGCLAVAWWAALAGQGHGWPVAGALLVAPPDPDRLAAAPAIRDFAPPPQVILPFPAIVVASEDDPYATLQRASDMARQWGAAFETVGALGHINAQSGLGAWLPGQRLLEGLLGGMADSGAAAVRPADATRGLAVAALR